MPAGRIDLSVGLGRGGPGPGAPRRIDFPRGRDPVDWFVRRAGLARFTTLSLAFGLALAALVGTDPVAALAGLMTALGGSVAGVPCRRSQRWSWVLLVSVLLTGLFAGYLVGTVRVAALTGSHLSSRVGDAAAAELVITGSVRVNSGWQSATAVVRNIRTGAAPAATGRHDPAVGESVLLEVAPAGDSTPVVLQQGMIVALEGTIQAPEGPSESGYDQSRQLLHQGIEVVISVDGSSSLTVVGRRGGVAGWLDRLRASAREHLSLGPSPRVNEALEGVVLGDTVGIDKGWMEAFRRSGTAHMLSVSGLHVGSIAGIVIGLARLLGLARWVGFISAALAAVLMVPFVGAAPPIVRSAVMILIVLAGRWVGRGRDQWQVLGLAAAVILAFNPFAIFDVGFQLSFSAFAGMLALTGPLQKVLGRLPEAIRANVAVSVAASLGTTPVSLIVFDRTSLVSPLANLLVVPLLPAVTGLGMASVLMGFIWSGLSVALDTAASIPMAWTVLVSQLMALAPVLGAADLGRALAALALGAAALPAALALTGRTVATPLGLPLPWFRRSLAWLRRRRPRNRRWAAALGAMVVGCAFLMGTIVYPVAAQAFELLRVMGAGRAWPGQVEVRVLEVGQGNAVLVRTPDRHAVLFDGGPEGCDLAGQLHSLGVRRLDLVVISHPHADHFAGLLEGLEGLKIETLIDHVEVVLPSSGISAAAAAAVPVGVATTPAAGVPAGVSTTPAAGLPAGPAAMPATAAASQAGGSHDYGEDGDEAQEYLRLRDGLISDGCRYLLAATGYTVHLDGLVVRFFAPQRPLSVVDSADPWAREGGAPTGDELNGASVVAMVSVGEIDVLIPGDAEADVLERYELPPAEVVVVPHHGSRGAVSDALLSELQARVAVISVGEGNSFGHPYAGTESMLREYLPTVLRTDTAGWVSCTVKEDALVITTERTPPP